MKAKRQREDTMGNPLTSKELDLMNAYWRACNYLSVGMIYLKDNPLLKEPLKTEDVKHRLLGHWGASPALSFAWAHLNRIIHAKPVWSSSFSLFGSIEPPGTQSKLKLELQTRSCIHPAHIGMGEACRKTDWQIRAGCLMRR